MQPVEGEYALTSGVLCFPASWTLSQKHRRGMMGIHQPVDRYDASIGKRVDRVFAMLQPDQAVWRANLLCYNDPNLFQPRLEHERRPDEPALDRELLRRERLHRVDDGAREVRNGVLLPDPPDRRADVPADWPLARIGHDLARALLRPFHDAGVLCAGPESAPRPGTSRRASGTPSPGTPTA